MNNYVDNKKFYVVLKQYIDDYNEALEKETELPRVPEFVGKCLMDIGTHYITTHHFSGYTKEWKEDMIRIWGLRTV